MSEALLTGVMLMVSVGSATVHGVAWWRLIHGDPAVGRAERRIRRGLVRTVVCRMFAAAVYIAVAACTVLAREALPVVALTVFTFTQVLWQANSYLDVRLRRDLARDRDTGPQAPSTTD